MFSRQHQPKIFSDAGIVLESKFQQCLLSRIIVERNVVVHHLAAKLAEPIIEYESHCLARISFAAFAVFDFEIEIGGHGFAH